MNTEVSPEFYWIAVAIVTVLSSARLIRLAVVDDFPPITFFRDPLYNWLEVTERRKKWQPITWCGFCASFWITLLVVGWADLSGIFEGPTDDPNLWASGWWFVNGTFAASYLAATYITRDGDDS